MINFNENENDNGKIDQMNKTNRPRRRYRDKYTKSILRLGKTMSGADSALQSDFVKISCLIQILRVKRHDFWTAVTFYHNQKIIYIFQ